MRELVGADFLDEMIAERTEANPEFPVLIEDATRRRAQRDPAVASTAAKPAQEPK